jgi:hypothetical protein
MTCPLCNTRRARRACPALGQEICPVCCGTKRLVEIRCPPSCIYLATARIHPPATVARQRERDFRFALTLVHKLPERVYAILLLFQATITAYRKAALPPLVDTDVAEAAASLAATLETAARGIIYEHAPRSLAAQRLMTALRDELSRVGQHRPGSIRETDAALALRRIETGARTGAEALGTSETAYLDFLQRLPDQSASPQASEETHTGTGRNDAGREADGPRLILP